MTICKPFTKVNAMKVYLAYDTSGSTVIGVFSSREKAETALRAFIEKNNLLQMLQNSLNYSRQRAENRINELIKNNVEECILDQE